MNRLIHLANELTALERRAGNRVWTQVVIEPKTGTKHTMQLRYELRGGISAQDLTALFTEIEGMQKNIAKELKAELPRVWSEPYISSEAGGDVIVSTEVVFDLKFLSSMSEEEALAWYDDAEGNMAYLVDHTRIGWMR
jgi:hypothetical protein